MRHRPVSRRDLGDDGPPFRWDEERRFAMRAELDAAFFHLYGIERDDVDYIMETFPIVEAQGRTAVRHVPHQGPDPSVYDAMADATQTGKPYQTILDPPPGHGRRIPLTVELEVRPDIRPIAASASACQNRLRST